MCDTPPDPNAVHCPHCKVEPGQDCRSPSGKPQIAHGERLHLAYALTFPEAGFYRAEAERYRLKWPDVAPRQVTCEPSAAQVRWWKRWGRRLRYDRQAYEREHGPDTSIPALPPCQQDDDLMPVSELLEQMDKVKAPARKRR